MAELPRKTYAQLSVASSVVDTDLLASYRSPGPLKSVTADILADYMRTKIGNADGFIDLEDYGTDGAGFRAAIAAGVAADKWVLVPAGTYTIDGAYDANGVLGLAGAGTVGLVCRDGWATLKLPLTAGTGTISTTLNSVTVTGDGSALFTSALIGKNLQNEDGEYIGKVVSVESGTSLTLQYPAWRVFTTGAWSYSSEARAFVTQTNGANVYFENIEFDCAAITSNFGHKAQAAGYIEGTNVRYRYKAIRFLDDATQPGVKAVASWNIKSIETIDVQGHGVTGGGDATTADTGSGYIGEVVCTNCTKSALNISVLRADSNLYIGRVQGIWDRWVNEGMPYPTQYATLRLGNGCANVTVDYVYGEGMFRLIRLTDPDNCRVNAYGFRDILGPVVLFNSKDQVSVNSGVGIGFGIGPNRGNGRPLPGDEDGESISNPNEEAVVIAEGTGYGFGPATFSADEYILGLGSITATSGTNTIVNRDTVLRGQDINCFDDVSVGDFLFNNGEELLGQVTAIGPKTYWLDVQETTTTLTPSLADHASQTATLSGGSLETVTAGTGTLTVTINTTNVTGGTSLDTQFAVGDTVCLADGTYVGRVAGSITATTMSLVSPGAKVGMAGVGFQIGSQYRQRTPDAYFYTEGGGLATVSGTAMTIPVPVAGTGTIVTSTSSKTVTGTSTAFTTQLTVGQHLFTSGNVSIGQIASITDADTLTLVDNALVTINPTAAFNYGYNFNDVLTVGDAIFKADDTLIGEIATITDYRNIVLSATALTTITGAAYQFGRWKKTARGVEIAETAINTNITLDDFWCQGAVTQYRLQQPQGIRPHNQTTIVVAQLATMDATERRGESWYVSDMDSPGWVVSNGTNWLKENPNGQKTYSNTTAFSPTYIQYAPTLRLSGNVGAGTTAIITLPTTSDVPDGAVFTFFSSGTNAGTWQIGSTVTRVRGGQWAIVACDKSSGTPVWRLVAAGNQADRIPKISRGSGTPEGSVIGSVADMYMNLGGAQGTVLWVKRSGDGTNTGWGNLASKLLLNVSATGALSSSQINQIVVVDASGGAITTTTPAVTALEDGTWITIKKNDTSTNRVTVLFNGSATERAWLRSPNDEVTLVIRSGAWEVLSYSIAPYETLGTASGTWTKPPLLSRLDTWLVAGGPGGGSGRKGAAGSVRNGGNGGNGAFVIRGIRAASELPDTVSYTVGAGGAGGAAVTADSTNGNAGAMGGTTSFGATTDAYYVYAPGAGTIGGGGAGGSTGAAANSAVTSFDFIQALGSAQSSTGGAGTAGGFGYGMSGASGGGITTGDVYSVGGAGRGSSGSTAGIAAGTAGTGATPGGAGGAAPAGTGVWVIPNAGAGGGSGGTGGGAGGNGGAYGGAGGGGGACLNDGAGITASGAGGNGANGAIRFIEWF